MSSSKRERFSTICAVCSPAPWHIQASDGNWTISKCRNEVGTGREFNKLLEVQKRTTSWTPARHRPHTGACAENTWEKLKLWISHQQNHSQDWGYVRNRGPTDLYLHNEAKIELHCKGRLLYLSHISKLDILYITRVPRAPLTYPRHLIVEVRGFRHHLTWQILRTFCLHNRTRTSPKCSPIVLCIFLYAAIKYDLISIHTCI